MVASDTIVGIVGATLLVAVMAGVFVYEYNNVDDATTNGVDGGDGDAAAMMAAFATAHPTLNASEDLDQDGVANYNDTDMDGDGIDNADDNETITTATGSGSTGPQGGPAQDAYDLTFFVGTGATTATITVTMTGTTPDPLASTTVDVLDPDGASVASGSFGNGAAAGSEVTIDFTPAAVGDYQVVVSQNPVGLGTSGDIVAMTTY